MSLVLTLCRKEIFWDSTEELCRACKIANSWGILDCRTENQTSFSVKAMERTAYTWDIIFEHFIVDVPVDAIPRYVDIMKPKRSFCGSRSSARTNLVKPPFSCFPQCFNDENKRIGEGRQVPI